MCRVTKPLVNKLLERTLRSCIVIIRTCFVRLMKLDVYNLGVTTTPIGSDGEERVTDHINRTFDLISFATANPVLS